MEIFKNCENNTDYSNCELLCEPVDLNSSDLEVRASTTDFNDQYVTQVTFAYSNAASTWTDIQTG